MFFWQRGVHILQKLSVQQNEGPSTLAAALSSETFGFFFPCDVVFNSLCCFSYVHGMIRDVKSIKNTSHKLKMILSSNSIIAKIPSNQAGIRSINTFFIWAVYVPKTLYFFENKIQTFNLHAFWITSGVSWVKSLDFLIDKSGGCGPGFSHGNGFVVVSLRWVNHGADPKLGK